MSTTRDDIVGGVIIRPIPWSSLLLTARAPYVLFTLAGLGSLPFFFSRDARDSMRLPWLALALDLSSIVVGICIFVTVEFARGLLRRLVEVFVPVSIVFGGVAVTGGMIAFGPSFGVGLLAYPQAAIFGFVLLRTGWAIAVVALTGIESALLFGLQDGWVAPAAQWVVLMVGTIGIGVMAGLLMVRILDLARSERRAHDDVAELNATLQQRVDAQVAELERTGELRRFLAPQVADAVLAGDAQELLAAHRQRVAVFFCDLRGFTAFAAQVEPEDVIEVLDTYYRIVGERLRAGNATIGSFAGDGIMAYLNDPVPCDDPAGTAVAIARDIRDAVQVEVDRWRRLGYDLGNGIGVAVGHATLGVVGFEGRQDYTALGTVVNLASRLCSAARDGQILIDPRTAGELGADVRFEPIEGVALKGFPDEMEIFCVR